VKAAYVVDGTLKSGDLYGTQLFASRGEFLARYRKTLDLYPVEALRVRAKSVIAPSANGVDDIERHSGDVGP
jgi:hypothetical protein